MQNKHYEGPLKKVVFFHFYSKKLYDTDHSVPRCSCTVRWFFWRYAISLPLPFVLIYFHSEDEDPFCLPPSFLLPAVLFIPSSQLQWKTGWRVFFSTCSRNMCLQNVFFFFFFLIKSLWQFPRNSYFNINQGSTWFLSEHNEFNKVFKYF